jgi:antitoxin (DNA-binding transcriptional repressor) of toxin-antitoxin stability system
MCHIVHMKAISIRELHLRTGRWVRSLEDGGPMLVTDRGRPIATLVPFEARDGRKGLPDREAAIAKLPRIPIDSADYVSEARDRA